MVTKYAIYCLKIQVGVQELRAPCLLNECQHEWARDDSRGEGDSLEGDA